MELQGSQTTTTPALPHTTARMADYEALKDSWSEVEDRDGVRLSWNVWPSSRMVSLNIGAMAGDCRALGTDASTGSLPTRRPHRRPLHTSQGKARHTCAAVRARYLPTAMPIRAEPLLVPALHNAFESSSSVLTTTSLQPSRRPSTPLDMSLLLVEKSSPATLQGHHSERHSPGAAPLQHHNRVPAVSTRA